MFLTILLVRVGLRFSRSIVSAGLEVPCLMQQRDYRRARLLRKLTVCLAVCLFMLKYGISFLALDGQPRCYPSRASEARGRPIM